jgi:hypothetical protein
MRAAALASLQCEKENEKVEKKPEKGFCGNLYVLPFQIKLSE